MSKKGMRRRMRRGKGRGGRTEFRIKFSELDRTLLFCYLFLPFPFLSLSLSLSLLSIARTSPPASLTAFALVPSPRPLVGARFFPTRSSGIPPLLTAACFSRPRTDVNPLLGDVPLRSFFDSTINLLKARSLPSCHTLKLFAKLSKVVMLDK